jgi:hypothetical protein
VKIKYYTQSRRGKFTRNKSSKANRIGHGLLKHIIEGKKEEGTEMMDRHGRKCKQILDDIKDMRQY